jgi:hypothetical protein
VSGWTVERHASYLKLSRGGSNDRTDLAVTCVARLVRLGMCPPRLARYATYVMTRDEEE